MRHVVLVGNSAWNLAHFRQPIIEAMVERGWAVTVVAPADGNEKRLLEMGAHFLPVAMRPSGRNPVADAIMAFRLWAIIRKLRPDLLLTFTIKPNIFGSLAGRLADVPVIATISGLGSAFLSGGLLTIVTRQLLRWSLRTVRTVFFQNQDDLILFTSLRLADPLKMRLVPGSGIDLRQFTALPILTNKPVLLLQIGRLLADKGVRELAAASKRLRAQGEDFRLVLLGDADADNPSTISREELQQWIDEGVIEHVPPVSDVRPWIAEATAVMLASYREGLPRSLLEGAAMGRPLIATDVPGCRDVVTDGTNGLLFAPRSADAAFHVMQRFLRLDPIELSQMGRESRAIAERSFDKSFVISAYLEEISE